MFDRYYNKIKNRLYNISPKFFDRHAKRKEIVKFLIAGCLAGGTDLVMLYIFHGLFHWGLMLSTSLAFIISFFVSFFMQKLWTFNDKDHSRSYRQLGLYLLLNFINLNLNGWLMHLLVNGFQIWYMLSQFVVGLTLGMVSFVVYKFVIFRRLPGCPPRS